MISAVRLLSKQEWVHATILSLCFALMVSFVSENLHDRFDLRAEFVAAQFATLAGEPYVHYGEPTYYPTFQNRVLFPAVLAALSQFKILSDEGMYLALRTAFAASLFALCWYVFRRVAVATPKQAAAGCITLACALVLTFNFKWVHTSDYPDAIFAVLMIAATVAHNHPLLAITAVLGATNRESAAFAGVFWVCVHGLTTTRKVQWKEIVFAAGVSIASYATVMGLRLAFGGPQAIGADTQVVAFPGGLAWSFRYAFDEPSLSAWPMLAFAMIIPLLLWIGSNHQVVGMVQRRLLLASAIVALITTVFGYVNELRIFIPSVVTLVFVATWSEALASKQLSCNPAPMES